MAAAVSELEVSKIFCFECKKEMSAEEQTKCSVCKELVHGNADNCITAILEKCPTSSVRKVPLSRECKTTKTLCTVSQEAGDKLIHLNIGGMKEEKTKINYIKKILTVNENFNTKPVVLALTDTRLDKKKGYEIANYKIQFLPPQRTNSGGIIMYIRDDFEITKVAIPLETELIDCLAVRIKPKNSNVQDSSNSFQTIFCVFYVNGEIYKNDRQIYLKYLDKVCEILRSTKGYRVIIMGDFNIDLTLDDTLTIDHQQILFNNDIMQLIRCPTREQCTKTGLSRRAIIDHLYMFEKKYRGDIKKYHVEFGAARPHKKVSDQNATYITYRKKDKKVVSTQRSQELVEATPTQDEE